MTNGDSGLGKRAAAFSIGTFVWFMIPSILAVAAALMLYLSGVYKTRDDFAGQVFSYANADSAARAEIRTQRPLIGRLAVELGATAPKATLTEDELRNSLFHLMRSHVAETIVFMSLMVMLPFVIMGSGLALSSDPKRREQARRGIGMKLMLALILAHGWQYIMNPMGITGTTLSTLVRYRGAMGESTAPIYLNLGATEIGVPLAAFFGFYCYLLGYFVYRVYNRDVLSVRVYTVMFRKCLFALGIAVVLQTASGPSTMPVAFLIGFLPLSALTLLSELGIKGLSGGEDGASLTLLPGITPYQRMRFEEEGIDGISTLAAIKTIDLTIPEGVISEGLLKHWRDIARLATVIGAERWKAISGVVMTASGFVYTRTVEEETLFRAELAKVGIANADEIRRLLRETFGLSGRSGERSP